MTTEKPSPENPIEEELMQEILLLLDNLAQREAVTVTMILERLYDVAQVNLIDKKVNSRTLKGVAKLAAKMSKPAFTKLALGLFQKKAPKLIGDFLYETVYKKINYQDKQQEREQQDNQAKLTPKEVKPQVYSLPEGEPNNLEVVKTLQGKVAVLTGMLIGSIALFGGSFLWLFTSL